MNFLRHEILRPVTRRVFWVLAALCLLLRLYLATRPGYVTDVGSFRSWAIGSALYGISAAYEKTNVDYPPLILYFLSPVGKVYIWSQPELRDAGFRRAQWGEYLFYSDDGMIYRSDAGFRAYLPDVELPSRPLPRSELLTFMVKALFIPFDFIVAFLLYLLVSAGGLWGEERSGPRWGRLAALLYLWNPAVLWSSGYWGESDAILFALVVAAVSMLAFDRPAFSGMLVAAAGLLKPLAVPLVPMIAAALWIRRRLGGLLLFAAGGVAASVLIFLPFLMAGKGPATVESILSGVDVMPHTSCNAHNFWWLIGSCWEDANAPVIGPLTPKGIGLTLFGVALIVLLFRSRRWMVPARDGDSVYRAGVFLLAAATAAAFFFTTTHLHEHHLCVTVPLLIAVAGRDRRLGWLALGCTLVSFSNMALHDLILPYRLPFGLSTPSSVIHPFMQRPFTWVQLVGSYVNSALAAIVAVLAYLAAWRTQDIIRK